MPPSATCLALQGGGALGAFTWGVLDAFAARGQHIEAVSGASAGAINAIVLAAGWMEHGPDGARAKLERFWRGVSDAAPAGAASALAAWKAFALPMASSPIMLNPLGLNPLRDLLLAEVDFERLRRESPIQLFVSATRVRDGAAQVFGLADITLEVALASACLPQWHEPVEIEGEPYWDGGYSANPPLLELVRSTWSRDLVIVELTRPAAFPAAGGRRIRERLNVFAFNAPFQREMEVLMELKGLVRHDPRARSLIARRLRGLNIHRIAAEPCADDSGDRAFDLSWPRLKRLAEAGSAAGVTWLERTEPRHGESHEARSNARI